MISLDKYSSYLDDLGYNNGFSLDDPKRLEAGRWKLSKRRQDAEIEKNVKQFFANRYNLPSDQIFDSIYKEFDKTVWNRKVELTVGKLREIDRLFRENLTYQGAGHFHKMFDLDVQKQDEFDSVEKERLPLKDRKKIFGFLHSLFHCDSTTKVPLNAKLLSSIIIEQDPLILEAFVEYVQMELNVLAESPPKTKSEEIVWSSFLGNLIAFLPYAYPQKGTKINIPVLNGLTVRMVNYEIDVIRLTRSASPITALAFNPINDRTAEPKLAIIGTTYPAGAGCIDTLLADFTPGFSVGEAQYEEAKAVLCEWAADKKNVHVYGSSLGGALAFNLLADDSSHTAKFYLYNPPGLYHEKWERHYNEGPEINVYYQKGDLVSQLGAFPEGKNVNVYLLLYGSKIPGRNDIRIKKQNFIQAHSKVYPGAEWVCFIKQNPRKRNNDLVRILITKAHQKFSWLIHKLFRTFEKMLPFISKRLKLWVRNRQIARIQKDLKIKKRKNILQPKLD